MKKSKNILISLAFAATIFVVSYLTHTKVGDFYVSLGDAFVMIAGCFLPTNFALLSALLGCGAVSFIVLEWPLLLGVVLCRVLAACWFMDDEKKILTSRTALGVGVSSFLFIIGGCAVEILKADAFAISLNTILASVLAALANVVLFLIIAFILDKFKIKEKFEKSKKDNK